MKREAFRYNKMISNMAKEHRRFHDENSNGELETNLLGIPTEPYCFSGSGHSKWKPPVYEDAKFVVSENEITLTLRLEKWKL
ncbi:MAG: DUF2141 domain-containing protein [Saprospiraceae bacterium]